MKLQENEMDLEKEAEIGLEAGVLCMEPHQYVFCSHCRRVRSGPEHWIFKAKNDPKRPKYSKNGIFGAFFAKSAFFVVKFSDFPCFGVGTPLRRRPRPFQTDGCGEPSLPLFRRVPFAVFCGSRPKTSRMNPENAKIG